MSETYLRPLVISVAVLGAIILISIFGPLFLPDPTTQSLESMMLPPLSPDHVLGTDSLGRDLLSRLVSGSRISLAVAIVGMAGSILVGTTAGLLAGSSNRWIAWLIDRLIDTQMALPYVLLAIIIVSAVGPGLSVLMILMVLAGWPSAARVVRSVTMAERAKDYVLSAEMIGASGTRVLFRYIGPTVIPVVLTIAPLQASAMIVMEASLSFLGLGIQPPTPSWGGILLDGKSYMASAWWLTTIPGLAIAVTAASMLTLGSSLEGLLRQRRFRRSTGGAEPSPGVSEDGLHEAKPNAAPSESSLIEASEEQK